MPRCSAVLFALLCIALASPAQAVQRAYVSAITGNDANTATNCPATAPCRWFATAVTVVDPNGEVVAMDSGAYGTVTLSQSVSLTAAPGAYAGISVFSGNGVTIATAGINVVLRGLTINGMGGSNGVYMTNGAELSIENCVISNFSSGWGVSVATAAIVHIVDSLFRDNGIGIAVTGGATASISGSWVYGSGGNGEGVSVTDTAATITKAYVDHSVASGNAIGFDAVSSTGGTTQLFVTYSVAANNSTAGIDVYASSGTAEANVSSSLVSGSVIGLSSGGSGAKLVASGNTVTKNIFGLYQNSSGVFESSGDNTVHNNGFDKTGTVATFSRM